MRDSTNPDRMRGSFSRYIEHDGALNKKIKGHGRTSRGLKKKKSRRAAHESERKGRRERAPGKQQEEKQRQKCIFSSLPFFLFLFVKEEKE